ncbi:MAG: sigma-54 dependent transcriptional regulator [Spongiibacteraceae bacterium]|jgi:two-component system response regulator FlrC|nr:sigma-54 dependent transcriptional regulator [Spongiibacteraceae bacterium]
MMARNKPIADTLQPVRGTVLVVEDDPDLREALTDTLELADYQVVQAGSAEDALALLERRAVDMVVSDVNMGDMDGLALLRQLRSSHPQLPVLLITAFGTIEKSVEAMRSGAVDYLVKPFQPQLLVEAVGRYVDNRARADDGTPVAVSSASQQLLQLAARVAATDSTVLILGESGTGKEVLARYVHRQSPRAEGPFVAINCAAIPDNMLEALLFGHERGAFTGAHQSAPGKFEQANGGTLLLDEVSEMPLGLQAKLLRVLQEREVERVGGRRTIALDVRVVATSNRELAEEVQGGRFREDLYYRLNVFPLQWSPLRERPEDILPLADQLLTAHTRRMGRSPARFDAGARAALLAHRWPGNVRELDNVVQRALIMADGPHIGSADLRLDALPGSAAGAAPATVPVAESASLGDDLQRREFQVIVDTLRAAGGSRKIAAERLGISPRTLRYKLARMREEGMDVEAAL